MRYANGQKEVRVQRQMERWWRGVIWQMGAGTGLMIGSAIGATFWPADFQPLVAIPAALGFVMAFRFALWK